jgi:RimJ/RimL family protein N-acetyltransferase
LRCLKETLVTERLVLRPLRLNDVESYHRVIDEDPKNAGAISLAQRRDLVHSYVQNDMLNGALGWWAIVLRSSNCFIGRCGVDPYVADFVRIAEPSLQGPHNRVEVELAYHIDAGLRRRGFAYEACSSLVAYSFEQTKLPRLVSVTSRTNTASQALMMKLGFRMYENSHPEYQGDAVGVLENDRLR